MSLAAALLATVVVWVLLYGHAHYRQLSELKRWMFVLVSIAVIGKGLMSFGKIVAGNIHHPPEWDFLVFWVEGVAASRGLNYYDAAVALHLAAPFHPDPDWIGITSAVPFPYPPPSIAWFLPLGWFEIHHAAAVWCAFSLACLCASIVVLCLTFFKGLKANTVVFTSALVLMLHSVYWNLGTCQTVFLLLLCIILALRYRNSLSGGAWLALAILVKPFAAVLMLSALLLRSWRFLSGTVGTLLVATLVTFAVFGRAVFSAYFAVPFDRLPMSMYTEIENQSVLAWLLRISHASTRFPAGYLILVALSGLVLLWWLSTRVRSEESCFGLVLVFGLLFYPASLRSYTVLLIVPILFLVVTKAPLLPIALAYGLTFFGDGNYVALATLIIGITLAMQMTAAPVEGSRLSYVTNVLEKMRQGYPRIAKRPTLGQIQP